MKRVWSLVAASVVCLILGGLVYADNLMKQDSTQTSLITAQKGTAAPAAYIPPVPIVDPCIAANKSSDNVYQASITSAGNEYNSRINYIPAMQMPGDPYNNGAMLAGAAKNMYNQKVSAAYSNYLATEKTNNCSPDMTAPSYL